MGDPASGCISALVPLVVETPGILLAAGPYGRAHEDAGPVQARATGSSFHNGARNNRKLMRSVLAYFARHHALSTCCVVHQAMLLVAFSS